ncbi:hypothetical protein [Ralstonia sp. OTU4908]|jgi:hypothetical protein|uniref:hypothetical protein n=1 Tax=Ralstonia sp. OTU4908 TaxID=3043851 RepID=UPI00313CB368
MTMKMQMTIPTELRALIAEVKERNASNSNAVEDLQDVLRTDWGWDVPRCLASDFIESACTCVDN